MKKKKITKERKEKRIKKRQREEIAKTNHQDFVCLNRVLSFKSSLD